MISFKRWTSAVAAAALALALGACGLTDDEAAGPVQASGPLQKCTGTAIKFQLSFFANAQYAPLLVAQKRGYWTQNGVKVNLVPGGPNISAGAQISQGLADMALIQFDEIQNANLKGADLVWVGQFYQRSPVVFAALKSTPLSKPADLKGLKVNTHPGDLDPELYGLLKLAGLGEDDVKAVPASPSVQDLYNRKVDVYQVQRFAHVAQLAAMGHKFPDDLNILDPNKYGVAVAPHGLAVRRDFLKKNPDAVGCFLAGLVQGVDTVLKDPAGVVPDVDALQEKGLYSTEQNKVNVRETAALLTTRPDGSKVNPLEIDNKFLAESQDKLVAAGLLREKPELGTFVDPAHLKRAQEYLARR